MCQNALSSVVLSFVTEMNTNHDSVILCIGLVSVLLQQGQESSQVLYKYLEWLFKTAINIFKIFFCLYLFTQNRSCSKTKGRHIDSYAVSGLDA